MRIRNGRLSNKKVSSPTRGRKLESQPPIQIFRIHLGQAGRGSGRSPRRLFRRDHLTGRKRDVTSQFSAPQLGREGPSRHRRLASTPSSSAARRLRLLVSVSIAFLMYRLLLLGQILGLCCDHCSVRGLAITSTEPAQASQHQSQHGHGQQSRVMSAHDELPSKKRSLRGRT
jgi:hypothetical protein